MNLATWSIRNPVPTLLLFLLLSLAGMWGFSHLSKQAFPDTDFPMIQVALSLPGAAPAQLETEVARKVEDSLINLDGINKITAGITDGMVSMAVEFRLGKPLSEALIDVKDAIDRIRNELPQELEDPVISKFTMAPGGALATYALASARMDREQLSWFVDDVIKKRIMGLKGVGDFARLGGVEREVRIEIDPIRATALGITVSDVSRALRSVQLDSSGGKGEIGGLEQGVRTLGTVERADELNALALPLPGGGYVRLDQVATISDTYSELTQAALLNGEPAVGFKIDALKGEDQLALFNRVEQALSALNSEYPDLTIKLVQTMRDNIEDQFDGAVQMLVDGALLAVLVIWLFLRDWRSTAIGAIALPLSILPTFAAMYYFDFTVNNVTMLALAVVVGILVDDAVVEVENISRHMNMGKPVRKATEDAVNEISTAVIGTTATLVAVFLPTAFMSGIAGMVFKQFGWTVVVAVLASLLVARMITPMMAVWMLRPVPEKAHSGPILNAYLKMVEACLRHKRTTMLGGTLFFFASLSVIPWLQFSFIPAEDNGLLEVRVELPAGSALETTLATSRHVAQRIQHLEGVKDTFVVVGGSQAQPGQVSASGVTRKASITVSLLPRGERPDQHSIQMRIKEAVADIPGARISFGASHPGEKMQIVLQGSDIAQLNSTASAIANDLRTLPFLSGVSSTASLERSEVTVRPDFLRMASLGVSTSQIGETLRIALSGDFEPALAKLNLENRQIDIRTQLPESFRSDLDSIRQLRVHSNAGLIPLSAVASVDMESGPSQIDRYNRERQVTVSADLGGYPLGSAMQARDKLPSVVGMPAGVRIIETGEAEFMIDMISSFSTALVIGVLMIYSVMVLLFKDWIQPITILSAVPLSIGGAFVALLVADHALGLPTLIGIIMLLGVVTKNSILLVDFAVMARHVHGLSLHDAIVDACRKRARPVVMTTVAMVAGLFPLTLGLGGGAALRQPMAIAVVGGLITSTGLSLLVVPVVYIYMSRLQKFFAEGFGRFRPGSQPELNSDGSHV